MNRKEHSASKHFSKIQFKIKLIKELSVGRKLS